MMMNKDEDEDAVEVHFDARLLRRAADLFMCHGDAALNHV